MKMKPALIATLVDEHYENLYRFALSLTRNEEEAADLTQQTYLYLAAKGGQIRDLAKAKSWLFTTLRREFYSMRKETGRFTAIDEKEHLEVEAPDNVEMEVLKQASEAMIMEGLSEIREVFRVPLALFYFEDFSYQEIAAILKVPSGTVMSRLYRGRAELRNWLILRLETDTTPRNIVPLRWASGE
ncbi:MAG: RNA polymerase sigma factor [Verrucomicrobiales bacterium]|nr:RNA polymerase sigma factor [Verrucomicrobiales bacterium]